jgi:acyl carrier protein
MHHGDVDIDRRLRELVSHQLQVDRPIDAGASLRHLGFDSTALLSLVVRLEEEFDIEVDDQDITADNFDTLSAMSSYVAGRRAQGPP